MALGALLTTLAPFHPRQLLQFSRQLFDDLAPLVLVLNNRRVKRTWGTIRDHPVNVAVRGDHLEKRHFKRYFLEFDGEATLKVFSGPVELWPVHVAWFWTQANAAVGVQRGHKKLVKPMNKLAIFRGGLPTIE